MEKIAAELLLKGLAPEGFADSQPIGLVTTDSREVCPGCIFVAFPGERFDGHDFAAKALEEGAAYVVLNHPRTTAASSTRRWWASPAVWARPPPSR